MTNYRIETSTSRMHRRAPHCDTYCGTHRNTHGTTHRHASCGAHRGTPRSAQRGVAALAVTLLLIFAMALTAAYANRGLWVEQRASANQYHAAQAFEAAEAGLEWATAQLNDPHRIDAKCRRVATGTAAGTVASTVASTESGLSTSFRQRFLHADNHTGLQRPVTWSSDGGAPVALQAGCVRRADGRGWSCSCATSGHPTFDSVSDDDSTTDTTDTAASAAAQPAFAVHFTTVAQAGVVRVTSTGCTSADAPCRFDTSTRADATSTVQALLGLLPGLSTAPMAALTAKGMVDAGPAALGIHNADAASGGTTVHSGGDLRGTAIRLHTAAGGANNASTATHDRALAGMPTDRLFAAVFGLDKATWKSHAAVQALRCRSDCAAAAAAALERTHANHLLWLDGDAQFDGPALLGTPEHPVVIVVNGQATLRGDVVLHGLLYAADVRWDGAAGGGTSADASGRAQTHGAVVSESGFQGHTTADLHYSAAVLRALQQRTGSFARVAGSWRDF